MQYPTIDALTQAYINNGWTGLDIPDTITYEPIQLGSGDPSPDNIRPILPATILNIGGTNVPVYGGSLDVTTGVLTVDRLYMLVTGESEVYRLDDGRCYIPISEASETWTDTSNVDGAVISDRFKNVSNVYSTSFGPGILLRANGSHNITISMRFTPEASTLISTEDWKAWFAENNTQVVYDLAAPITYQCTPTELQNAIGIKDDIAHRLKLPLPHYFPHSVIDALQRAAAGTQTADDTEVLRHYLTPLGIGGI